MHLLQLSFLICQILPLNLGKLVFEKILVILEFKKDTYPKVDNMQEKCMAQRRKESNKTFL